jgi:adenine-specific DNA-methyltransferase
MSKQKELDQFFTPVWAAEILYNKTFPELNENDLVWEPTCGKGSFLSAVPQHIRAIGTEIDPELVKESNKNTGRLVYHGDFRTVHFEKINEVTAIIGNPPFDLDMFETFMERCEDILPFGNKAAFIIPAYFMQTSKTFKRLTKSWDIDQKMMPRDLFQTESLLSKPLVWAQFIRDASPVLSGFILYNELIDIKSMLPEIKEALTKTINKNGSIWRQVLVDVVKDIGGTATLEQIYKKIEGKRPTKNPYWKEKVRQIIRQSPFESVDTGKYKLAS